MTDLYQAVLDDRDRLLETIEQQDIKIAELERAIALRDQLMKTSWCRGSGNPGL